MRLIGLTGGIGMGKSTVADYLVKRGESVLDTDVLARQLVQPGQDAYKEIRREFGDGVITSGGEVDRKALARMVFDKAELRTRLESILHPRIRARWLEQVRDWRNVGRQSAIVVIPLLYETDAKGEFDYVICVACSRSTQGLRLRARGWSEDEIVQRNAAQMPPEKKMDLADGVIWNESTIEICEEQCRRLI